MVCKNVAILLALIFLGRKGEQILFNSKILFNYSQQMYLLKKWNKEKTHDNLI